MESEELIKLVDGIYKNILEKFNPGARQMIYAGKAYLKALHGAAAASRLYVETISKLARQAQQGTWGGSSDIGAALMKVVDVFKEIQDQQMNILKAFYVDLLVPLETNLEKDTKVVQSEQKRFLQQHKQRVETYSKVAATMKKQRKKSRGNSKSELAMDKELKNMQMLEQEKTKLDAFCEQSLRNAMTQERRRYGFVLERQCSLAKHQLSYYSVAATEYQLNVGKWEEISKTRECLPETALNIFSNKLRGIPSWQTDDVYSNPRSPIFEDDRLSQASQLRKTKSIDTSSLEIGSIGGVASPTGTISRAKSEFNLNSHYPQDVHLQRPKSMAIPPPPQWDAKLAKALYAYLSSGENQLSFLEDDIIALIGKRNKGWQFGENLRTQSSGWFPLAYTELLDEPNMTPSRSAVSRSRNDLTHAESHKSLDTPTGNNDLFSQRMFGDTVHFNRTSSNAKQILHALDSNKMPPPTSPPPVPKTSSSYRNPKQMMLSHSTNSLTRNYTQTVNSSNNRPSRNMRGGNSHQNYQVDGIKGIRSGMYTSSDSGFDNEPPVQPEIDYMEENSGGGQSQKNEAKSSKHGKNDKNNNLLDESLTKNSYGSLSRSKYEMANDQIEKKLKRTKSFWKFNKNNSETEILEGMSLWKHRDLVDLDEKIEKNIKIEKHKPRDRSSDSDRTVTNKSSKNTEIKKKEIKKTKEERDVQSQQDSDYEYNVEKTTKNTEFYDDEDGLLLKTVNRKNILQQYDNEDSDSTTYSEYNIPRDNPYDCILVNDQKIDKKQTNLRAKLQIQQQQQQQKNNENEKNKLNNKTHNNVHKKHNNEIIQFPEIRHSLRTFKSGKAEKIAEIPTTKKTSYESIKSENSERKWGVKNGADFESVYADSDYEKYEKNDFYGKSLQRRNKQDYETKYDKVPHNGDMCGPWYDLWNLDVTARK